MLTINLPAKIRNGSVARIISDGIYHSAKQYIQDDRNIEEEQWLDLAIDAPMEIDQAIEKALQKAQINGISEKSKQALKQTLIEFKDVLRIRLGNDPPADVEPMKIEIQANTKPYSAKKRRYPKEAREVLEKYTDRLLEYGFGKINTNAQWIAAPVIVEKAPPALFRLTFCLLYTSDAADD